MSQDAYAYWQNKMKSTDKKPAANDDNDSDFENDDDDEGEIDFSGSEKKFSDHDDDDGDYDYSMKDDDFAISTSFKQGGGPLDKNPSTSKKGTNETASAAKERLAKIMEEEKKAEREAKLKEIMR